MNNSLSAEQALKEVGFLAETTAGSSMLPLFKNRRDTVIIKPVGDERLKKYDVPLYRRGQKLVLHRIVKVRENDYLICGDNCEEYEIVTDDQIIGVLSEFYRKNKHHTVEDKGYLRYAKVWVAIFPLRKVAKFFYKVYLKLRQIGRRIFKKEAR